MILSTIVVGLVLGGTYALIALGLTIQYGVARIMNLAYGEFVIAGSFFTFFLVSNAGLDPLLGLLVIVPIGYAVSYLLYDLVMQPLVVRSGSGPRLEVDSILVTFGIMFVIQGLLVLGFGSGFTGYSYLQTPVNILGANIAAGRVIGFVLALVVGIGLYIVMRTTRWGVNMRAVATRPAFAPLVGIDTRRQARIAFATGGALAATGGVILSLYQTFTAVDGVALTMKALVIVIMGGVGNLAGALAAGLMIGLVEAGVSVAFDPGLTLAATYAIFLGVLLWRPSGLFR